MHAERTPNPHSVKWVLGQEVVPAGLGVTTTSFTEAPDASVSPLVSRLFEVEGVVSVLLGPDFVTVSKDAEKDWAELAPPIVAGIKAWAGASEPALGDAWQAPELADEDDVIATIRRVIEQDVQPYVAMDGGEIAFAGYRDGTVEVYLRGACAGCPSSTITLKMGIEARLKEEVPEVQAVVAI